MKIEIEIRKEHFELILIFVFMTIYYFTIIKYVILPMNNANKN